MVFPKSSKLRVKTISAAQVIVRNGEINKPKNTVFKSTQQFLNREPRTNIQKILIKRSSSKQEHKENALASGAEERRDKLR